MYSIDSDPEDDYYANAAKKFQSLKSEYKSIKLDENHTKNYSETSDIIIIKDSETIFNECNTSVISVDDDDLYIDSIIAKKTTSKCGRKLKVPEANIESHCERITRNRRKTALSKNPDVCNIEVNEFLALDSDTETTKSNKRKGGKSAKSRGNSAKKTRGKGSNNARGATRGRGRGRNSRQNRTVQESYYPTYNIGDVVDYPDMCSNQQLFSTNSLKTSNDVEIIDNDDPLDNENEEISVKVLWQSTQVFRFKIRKFQKLTQIYKYFSEQENICNEKLLFMYNDRIVRADDSPNSINYNIAQFIDGGMINRDVTTLVKPSCSNLNPRRDVNDGFRIKFQCQVLKKPFEATIKPEDKLATAMILCAEHLELPMRQLKFYFDGDLITSKMTPQELGLESGDRKSVV